MRTRIIIICVIRRHFHKLSFPIWITQITTMIPKRVAVEDGAGGTQFPLDRQRVMLQCRSAVRRGCRMSSGLPLCTDRSGAEISEGRNDTGTVYNCALINSGLSPLFHFRVFDHLPKHCLNIILVKYKCEKLHDLFI